MAETVNKLISMPVEMKATLEKIANEKHMAMNKLIISILANYIENYNKEDLPQDILIQNSELASFYKDALLDLLMERYKKDKQN